MSNEWLTWAYKQRVGDGTAKAVLVVIADHADEKGYAYPSIKKIVENCEFQKRTVLRAIEKLVSRGLLARRERRRKNGAQAVNDYLLRLSPEAAIVWPDDEENSRRRPQLKQPVDKQGVLKSPSENGEANDEDAECLKDTGGGVLKSPINEEPPLRTPNITPKPPKAFPRFNIEHYLTDRDRDAVRQAAKGFDVKMLTAEYNGWVFDQKIAVRNPVKHFLEFINTWVEKEKRRG